MKKSILIMFMTFMAITTYAKDIKELIVTTTPPMSCQNCEKKIKDNIRFEKGIKNIETNLGEQRVAITYDADKTNPEKIEKAFSKIGYHVEVIEANGNNTSSGNNCPEEKASVCNGSCCSSN